MFKAMVQALLEPQPDQEPMQSKVVEDEEEPLPSKRRDPPLSLPEVDPAGFYTNSAFFAKPPARVWSRVCLSGLRR